MSNVVAYYLGSASSWEDYGPIRKMVARDHERGVSTMIHHHKEGELCNEKCKLLEAE